MKRMGPVHVHSCDDEAVVRAPSGACTEEGALSTAAAGLVLPPDRPPRLLDAFEPDYPTGAEILQGTVTLRLHVSADGAVEKTEVLSAEPAGVFDASAIDAFSRARFAPAQRGGANVPGLFTVAVDFSPINRGSAVSGQGTRLFERRARLEL